MRQLHDILHMLGVSKQQVLRCIVRSATDTQVLKIPKASGGVRKVYNPSPMHKGILRKFKAVFLDPESKKLGLHVGAYIPDRPMRTCIEPHEYSKIAIKLDLKDFFDSVTEAKAISVLTKYCKFSPDGASLFGRLLTHGTGKGRACVQGFPTSGDIANLYVADFDKSVIRMLDFLASTHVSRYKLGLFRKNKRIAYVWHKTANRSGKKYTLVDATYYAGSSPKALQYVARDQANRGDFVVSSNSALRHACAYSGMPTLPESVLDFTFWMPTPPPIRYSRYSDDLTISCDKELPRPMVDLIISQVRDVLHGWGLKLNEDKVRVLRGSRQKIVLGASISTHLNPPRKIYRKYRALVHNISVHGFSSCLPKSQFTSAKDLYEHVLGMVQYMHTLNPHKVGPSLAKLKQARLSYSYQF